MATNEIASIAVIERTALTLAQFDDLADVPQGAFIGAPRFLSCGTSAFDLWEGVGLGARGLCRRSAGV